MAKQIMSVTGHKSIQYLCIYQRVKEDEKLMMDMSLTYSLLNPKEVREVKEALQKQRQLQEIQNDLEIEDTEDEVNTNTKALPAPIEIQPHALDPNVPQLVPLDNV